MAFQGAGAVLPQNNLSGKRLRNISVTGEGEPKCTNLFCHHYYAIPSRQIRRAAFPLEALYLRSGLEVGYCEESDV